MQLTDASGRRVKKCRKVPCPLNQCHALDGRDNVKEEGLRSRLGAIHCPYKKPTSKSEATRARILDVALDLFRRQGFDPTTMRHHSELNTFKNRMS
jgi:hypothetical protein